MSGRRVAVVGAGPAGLIAAERLAAAGHAVTVYDRMPTPARKLLIAGRGGLNLTHSEPLEIFLNRYGVARARLEPAICAFPPEALRAWCEGLGEATFVGSSGRVFPTAMKASPLLRAWLKRLDGLGVVFRFRHRWLGWANDGRLRFAGPEGNCDEGADATLLALGGASWPRLGSDGGWVDILTEQGIAVAPLRPANCGFCINWSQRFRDGAEGQPLKRIALSVAGRTVRGEAMVTATGLEGGAVYALSKDLRDAIAATGRAAFSIDLRPDLSAGDLAARLSAPRRAQSLSSFLRKKAALPPAAVALLHEAAGRDLPADPARLVALIKAVPLTAIAPFPIDRAISSAGGIALSEIDDGFMLRRRPGVFVAGEMLDWEAPTGGYLLQASFATGVAAAAGIARFLTASAPDGASPGRRGSRCG